MPNDKQCQCDGSGYILEVSSFEGKECQCMEWKRLERIMNNSGIEEKFRKITFEDFTIQGLHRLYSTARNMAKDYAEGFKKIRYTKNNGIGLMGTPGSGKTTLLMAVCNEIMSQKIPVIYFQHREQFDRLKATNFYKSDELYERLKNFPGLVFWDDLFKTIKKDSQGNKSVADWEADATWTVINFRIQRELPIAFSTEWKPAELINMDQSLAGRLFERAKDRIVTFRLTNDEIAAGMNPLKVFDRRFDKSTGEE